MLPPKLRPHILELLEKISTLDHEFPGNEELIELYDIVHEMLHGNR